MTQKTSRFGQGIEVDRARPHFFHRDYWILRHLRDGVSDFLSTHAAELKDQLVLDFGAGDSPYIEAADRHGIRLVAADINPPQADIIAIDPTTGRIDLPDDHASAVLSTQVLEHVANVQGYLREAHRVLRPGGLIFCSTHGASILHRHPTDFRRWTIDGLQWEMEQSGFTVDAVTPKIGILATATHLRSITLGGITRRVPLTGWLRPIIYGLANLRMGIEDRLTPSSIMPAHPSLLIAVGRKPTR